MDLLSSQSVQQGSGNSLPKNQPQNYQQQQQQQQQQQPSYQPVAQNPPQQPPRVVQQTENFRPVVQPQNQWTRVEEPVPIAGQYQRWPQQVTPKPPQNYRWVPAPNQQPMAQPLYPVQQLPQQQQQQQQQPQQVFIDGAYRHVVPMEILQQQQQPAQTGGGGGGGRAAASVPVGPGILANSYFVQQEPVILSGYGPGPLAGGRWTLGTRNTDSNGQWTEWRAPPLAYY